MRKKTARVALVLLITLLLTFSVVMSGCGDSDVEASTGEAATSAATSAATAFVVTSPVPALTTSIPTMNKHAERNVACAQCHGEDAPTGAPLSNEACYSCHDLETIVAATASYDDPANKSQNPHDSHLYGTSCFTCHKNHSESVLYCDECHLPAFGWDVP